MHNYPINSVSFYESDLCKENKPLGIFIKCTKQRIKLKLSSYATISAPIFQYLEKYLHVLFQNKCITFFSFSAYFNYDEKSSDMSKYLLINWIHTERVRDTRKLLLLPNQWLDKQTASRKNREWNRKGLYFKNMALAWCHNHTVHQRV